MTRKESIEMQIEVGRGKGDHIQNRAILDLPVSQI